MMNRRNFLTLMGTPLLASSDLFIENEEKLNSSEWLVLLSLRKRLIRLKNYVGYRQFNIISYKSALYYARNYSSIGAFTNQELSLIDMFFHEDPSKYGFFGGKTCSNINNNISKKDIVYISGTGHYLFKGKPFEDYHRLLTDVGDTLILTSGIRNVIKQTYLYVNKIYKESGSITKASLSIAPPSYSYHTIQDFDVGKKGLAGLNFTPFFATTKEYRSIRKLHYIDTRYTMNNKDGVRYEPWHIQVI